MRLRPRRLRPRRRPCPSYRGEIGPGHVGHGDTFAEPGRISRDLRDRAIDPFRDVRGPPGPGHRPVRDSRDLTDQAVVPFREIRGPPGPGHRPIRGLPGPDGSGRRPVPGYPRTLGTDASSRSGIPARLRSRMAEPFRDTPFETTRGLSSFLSLPRSLAATCHQLASAHEETSRRPSPGAIEQTSSRALNWSSRTSMAVVSRAR